MTKIELTKEKVEGGWNQNSRNHQQHYSRPRERWGYWLEDDTGYRFFLGFVRKRDAVEAEPYLRAWDGRGCPEMAIVNAGYMPEGYKGIA